MGDSHEEKLKEKEEFEELEKKIKEEEEKEKCIKKAIKRKSVAQQRKAHALEVAAKINEIKQNTLAQIKMDMTKDMLKAENEGDATKCKISSSISYKTEYCNDKFGEDWLANKNCRDEAQFCWVCCEQEFGQMHIDARDAC